MANEIGMEASLELNPSTCVDLNHPLPLVVRGHWAPKGIISTELITLQHEPWTLNAPPVALYSTAL